MSDISPQDVAKKLLSDRFMRNGPVASTLSDPIEDTYMVVTLDELRPYEHDPRLTRNPLYDDIKASIRERGLDAPPPITRRPGADHYIIRNGGNTRLAILRELWSETRDERFFRIACQFRPWPERGEIIALTGHLAENELHGGLSFIERALGVQKTRELYEQETGKPLSQSELARRLKADGYPVSQPHISRMQEAIQYLLPAIPTLLYAGLGRRQVEQLTSLRRTADRVWAARGGRAQSHVDFPTLFQDVLVLFDSAAGGFSVQRVQDELVGQMAELLDMEYDTLLFEITDSDRRWEVLSREPNDEPELNTTPASPQLSSAALTEPPSLPATPESASTTHSAPVAAPHATDTPSVAAGRQVTTAAGTEEAGDDQRATLLQEHIVSPAGTTERLQSIQRLVADHTGEVLPDFEHNVLQAIPIQVGSLYPISDVWYIEPSLDDPDRLRMHIAQFAREIAGEAEVQDLVESCKAGIGFRCRQPGAEPTPNRYAQATVALLHALSTPYLAADERVTSIDLSFLTEILGTLLLGAPAGTGAQQGLPHRLSDNALVKLFRLLRLSRRLSDIETGILDGDHAITGS
ncbi:ParB family protein [Pseudomonas sp. FME51]|uniref:ParB family protein n=1 Tax=Pseudomonas sp. FME51 TaxID=2742609 RepID=UPI0018678029|nr:ParB family protein [Pseudomonas sp. FME51]